MPLSFFLEAFTNEMSVASFFSGGSELMIRKNNTSYNDK